MLGFLGGQLLDRRFGLLVRRDQVRTQGRAFLHQELKRLGRRARHRQFLFGCLPCRFRGVELFANVLQLRPKVA